MVIKALYTLNSPLLHLSILSYNCFGGRVSGGERMREGGGGNSCMKSINYSCCAPLLSCAFSLSDFLLYLLGSPCSNLLLNGTSCFFF